VTELTIILTGVQPGARLFVEVSEGGHVFVGDEKRDNTCGLVPPTRGPERSDLLAPLEAKVRTVTACQADAWREVLEAAQAEVEAMALEAQRRGGTP